MGVLDRLVLSDAAWERVAPLIIDVLTRGARRDVTTGCSSRACCGSCGPDRPGATCPRRFSRWSRKGVWWRIFEAMSDDPDFEYLIVDSTIVRAHQHSAGAKKGGLKIRPSAARAAA